MKLALVVLAVVIGAVLVIEVDTGSVTALQIAGLGIICAAAAVVAP